MTSRWFHFLRCINAIFRFLESPSARLNFYISCRYIYLSEIRSVRFEWKKIMHWEYWFWNINFEVKQPNCRQDKKVGLYKSNFRNTACYFESTTNGYHRFQHVGRHLFLLISTLLDYHELEISFLLSEWYLHSSWSFTVCFVIDAKNFF